MEVAILGRAKNWSSTGVYGLAHLGKSLFWYSSEILFAYFLTELAGLPAAQMGVVLATGFLVGACVDLGVARGLRQRLTAPRAAGRMQLLGAVLCSATLALVFAGALLPPPYRFAFSIVAGVLFRLAFAVYDLPQNALMAMATPDAAGRLRVATTRIWFSGSAILIVAGAVGPMLAAQHRAMGVGFLVGLTGAFAIVAVLTAGLLAWVLRDSAAPARDEVRADRAGGDAGARWRSGFWRLVGIMLVTSALTPIFTKLEPYFAAFVLRSSLWGGAIIVLTALGILAGQPLWLTVCRRFAREAVMVAAALTQIAALGAFWVCAGSSLFGASVAAFVFGLGNGGVGMVMWASFADLVARLPAARVEISYGVFAASAKVGLAASGFLLWTALGGAAYREAGSPTLVLAMTALPAVGALLVIGAAVGRLRQRPLAAPGAATPS